MIDKISGKISKAVCLVMDATIKNIREEDIIIWYIAQHEHNMMLGIDDNRAWLEVIFLLHRSNTSSRRPKNYSL
jgi:hypothetical protein